MPRVLASTLQEAGVKTGACPPCLPFPVQDIEDLCKERQLKTVEAACLHCIGWRSRKASGVGKGRGQWQVAVSREPITLRQRGQLRAQLFEHRCNGRALQLLYIRGSGWHVVNLVNPVYSVSLVAPKGQGDIRTSVF